MRNLILFACVLSACTSYEKTGDISVDTQVQTNPDTAIQSEDSGLDTSASAVDGNAPVIQSCDAFCWEHTTGDTYWGWKLDCQVTDPDGPDNIWNGRANILRNGNILQNYLVACQRDTGNCTTTFREETDGILCSQASTYNFIIWIKDWDQHESAPYTVQGRQL